MTDTPHKPADQRPETPDFWDKRFQSGITPWDAGGIPADLLAYLDGHRPGRVLIPGCGSAWEAAHFAAANWQVTALDFSPVAIERARDILGDWSGELVCGDFFTWAAPAPLQLIYERAFLCALPRKLWADWAARVAALLPSGACLAGYFFVCDQLKGPPFGIDAAQLNALLDPHFICREDRPSRDPIPVFAGRERWQVWERR